MKRQRIERDAHGQIAAIIEEPNDPVERYIAQTVEAVQAKLAQYPTLPTGAEITVHAVPPAYRVQLEEAILQSLESCPTQFDQIYLTIEPAAPTVPRDGVVEFHGKL